MLLGEGFTIRHSPLLPPSSSILIPEEDDQNFDAASLARSRCETNISQAIENGAFALRLHRRLEEMITC